ncbi:DNA-directed RNA polymerase [Labrenzia sp. EL_126]|nr:DNA-directed RNA polymerase [Labrenzia sp. EL_126]
MAISAEKKIKQQRQQEREINDRHKAVDDFRRKTERAIASGNVHLTRNAHMTFMSTIGLVAEALKVRFERAVSGAEVVNNSQFKKYFDEKTDWHRVAHASMMVLINGLIRYDGKLFYRTGAAASIGVMVMTVEHARVFLKASKRHHKALYSKHKVKRNARYLAAAYRRNLRKHYAEDGEMHFSRSDPETIELGDQILQVIASDCQLVNLKKEYIKDKTPWVVEITETLDAVLAKCPDDMNNFELRPQSRPLVIPPKPYKSLTGGGYHTEIMRRPLFAKLPKDVRKTYSASFALVEPVADLVNIAGSVGYKVDTYVLDAMSHLDSLGHSAGHHIGNFMSTFDKPEVSKEGVDFSDGLQLMRWQSANKRVKNFNDRTRAQRLEIMSEIGLAQDERDEPELYSTFYADSRGRVYPRDLPLQGTDSFRALYHFAEGVPVLGNADAERWFGINLATLYGGPEKLDKASFDERVSWFEKNRGDLLQVASDPVGHIDFWSQTDKPWQFLGALGQLKAVAEGGVSHQPIAMDAASSGIAIWSSILRSESGCHLTGLEPMERPSDLYKAVADIANRRLFDHNAEKPFLTRELDQGMVEMLHQHIVRRGGISRSMAKSIIMPLLYGQSDMSASKAMMDALGPVPEGWYEDLSLRINGKASLPYWYGILAARYVQEGLKTVLPEVYNVRNWLDECGKVFARAKQPIVLGVPSGFLYHHAPQQGNVARANCAILGKQSYVKLSVYKDQSGEYDTKQGASSFAANVTHSLDAALLHRIVTQGKAEGIKSFRLVHDDISVPATGAAQLHDICRKSMHWLCSQQTIIQQIVQVASLSRVDIPEPPTNGKHDISSILEADFCFH